MGGCLSSGQRETSLLEENMLLRHRVETLLQHCSTNDTEMRRLFECKICFDPIVSTVFIPCGHCMTCKKCAMAFTQCPLCAVPIEDVTYVTFP
jgi:hypothetical protein